MLIVFPLLRVYLHCCQPVCITLSGQRFYLKDLFARVLTDLFSPARLVHKASPENFVAYMSVKKSR